MGDLVVQQFVNADGFAANDQNEFDLFDRLEGDSSAFDQSNLVARERRGDFEEATIESGDAAEAIRRLRSEVRVTWSSGAASRSPPACGGRVPSTWCGWSWCR